MELNPLRHPILFGEYDLTIDEKNRLPIPALVRKLINPEVDGDAFFMVVGGNRKPWLYPKRYYEELVMQVPAELTPGAQQQDFDQLRFAMTSLLEWDAQGRILIPERTLKRTGLNREVTLFGSRDHLELWNRDDWEVRREELIARSEKIALPVRQDRTKAP